MDMGQHTELLVGTTRTGVKGKEKRGGGGWIPFGRGSDAYHRSTRQQFGWKGGGDDAPERKRCWWCGGDIEGLIGKEREKKKNEDNRWISELKKKLGTGVR